MIMYKMQKEIKECYTEFLNMSHKSYGPAVSNCYIALNGGGSLISLAPIGLLSLHRLSNRTSNMKDNIQRTKV
jgi:hypothetical protein